eukprot:SAG22_NODE_252_length_13679_cov_74.486524_7_plen_806_part_00
MPVRDDGSQERDGGARRRCLLGAVAGRERTGRRLGPAARAMMAAKREMAAPAASKVSWGQWLAANGPAGVSDRQLAREGLLTGQREGRLLMREGAFADAAGVYTACLECCEPAAFAAGAAGAEAVAAAEQGPCMKKVVWSPTAGSAAEVALSTRLLLARALLCVADRPDGDGSAPQQHRSARFDAAFAEADGVARSDRLAPASPLRHEALKLAAKLCGLAGGEARLATGVECCQLLRAPAAGLFFRDPFEHALVCELEAGLHALGCRCPQAAPTWASGSTPRPAPVPPGSRCSCPAGAAALAAMEMCVASGKQLAARGGSRKEQRRQAADLALVWRAWRGLAEADKAAAAAQAERKRLKKARSREKAARLKAVRGHVIDALLARLAGAAAARRPVIPGLCVPSAAPGAALLDWAAVPAGLHPAFKKDSEREQRKRWQLESMHAVLTLAVDRLQASRSASAADSRGGEGPGSGAGKAEARRLRIVDFGSGSGNSALALAAALPACDFVLIDVKDVSIRLANERAAAAGLTNVEGVHSLLEDYTAPFDIALATHLCGAATDAAQALALRHNAVFILIPCCLGKIKLRAGGFSGGGDLGGTNNVAAGGTKRPRRPAAAAAAGSPGLVSSLKYPRSAWLQREMPGDPTGDYLHLVRLSDCEHDGRLPASSRKAQREQQLLGHAAAVAPPRDHGLQPQQPPPPQLPAEDVQQPPPSPQQQQQPPSQQHQQQPQPPQLEVVERAGAADPDTAAAAANVYRLSKVLLDADRLTVAAEAGYSVGAGNLNPPEASKKNDVLLGFPAALGPIRPP